MKKFVVPALLVAGITASALVGATSVSWAQESAPSCAQAISAFLDARTAFEKLPEKIDNPDLVKLAEDVEKATKVRDQRKDALDKAKAAADTAESGNSSVGITDRAAVVARIAELRKFINAANPANPADQVEKAKGQLAARQDHLRAIDTLASAQSTLDAATKARKNAPARIDNPALKAGKEFDALAKTQTAADTACEGQPNDPGPVNPGNPGGSNDDQGNDNGGSQVDNNNNSNSPDNSGVGSVVTPVGGVETGGGPA